MEKRRALVIGASSRGGLGEAVARRLDADGLAVSLAGRSVDRLADLVGELGGAAYACDVTDEAQIEALVASIGSVDVVVNAAGTTLGRTIRNVSRAEIEQQMAIHVIGNILLLKHFAGIMPRGGSIVLFSSLTAQRAGSGLVAYAAAKAALEQVVKVAAIEFGPLGIRVNAVAPGFSQTPMTEAFLAIGPIHAVYAGESAMQALVTPAQVAATVSYLAAADCFTTGETLQASGGAQLFRLPGLDELRNAKG